MYFSRAPHQTDPPLPSHSSKKAVPIPVGLVRQSPCLIAQRDGNVRLEVDDSVK